jgi:seryl-tRNA synthetase
MLDTKFIREHVEEVKENIKNRHTKAAMSMPLSPGRTAP